MSLPDKCPHCGDTVEGVIYTRWEKFEVYEHWANDQSQSETTGDVKVPKTGKCRKCGKRVQL